MPFAPHVKLIARRAVIVFALAFAPLAWGQTAVLEPDVARLFEAIDDGRELLAEGLIRGRKVDVNARNAAGETPLHRAVERGMKELAHALVGVGANLRARSATGETALHLAALHDDPALADLLVAAGADPRARNDDGESVLQWAALTGNVKTALFLLERGADPNTHDLAGNGVLHAAADAGSEELVKFLLPRVKEPWSANRAGRTAKDLASAHGYAAIARLLEVAAQMSGGTNLRTLSPDEAGRRREER
ncbi:MAG: ankyrin repeat domain-containing protein [Betaproteobacteria bacterium]|nr:ankyrin repeat domain-containing protein [Betaproteobacteria bacterium]